LEFYGQPHVVVADMLRSYGYAVKVIGNANRQEIWRWLKTEVQILTSHFDDENKRYWASIVRDRCRNSPPCTLPFTSVSTWSYLYSRANSKLNRGAALSEWRPLCSA